MTAREDAANKAWGDSHDEADYGVVSYAANLASDVWEPLLCQAFNYISKAEKEGTTLEEYKAITKLLKDALGD